MEGAAHAVIARAHLLQGEINRVIWKVRCRQCEKFNDARLIRARARVVTNSCHIAMTMFSHHDSLYDLEQTAPAT